MAATPQCDPATVLWMKISAFCRYFLCSTLPSTGVEDGRRVAEEDNEEREGAATSIDPGGSDSVENFGAGRVVYTRGSPHSIDRETT
jgi:hypothetical protein